VTKREGRVRRIQEADEKSHHTAESHDHLHQRLHHKKSFRLGTARKQYMDPQGFALSSTMSLGLLDLDI
jgi:hypothetical protein